MPPARRPRPLACLLAASLLGGCLATPVVEPPVVATSERRAHYRGDLHSVIVLPPAGEAQAGRSNADLGAQLDAAVRRHLRQAGVPTLVPDPGARRPVASHTVSISAPAVPLGRTALQVELRDTLTRTVVWRFAGELDARSRPPEQLAERLAGSVIHRLREDGLLAR